MFPQFVATIVGLAIAAYSIDCINITISLLFMVYIAVVIKTTFYLEYVGQGFSADAFYPVINTSIAWGMIELIVHPIRYGLILTFMTYLYVQSIKALFYK
jgi:hypothetical protein